MFIYFLFYSNNNSFMLAQKAIRSFSSFWHQTMAASLIKFHLLPLLILLTGRVLLVSRCSSSRSPRLLQRLRLRMLQYVRCWPLNLLPPLVEERLHGAHRLRCQLLHLSNGTSAATAALGVSIASCSSAADSLEDLVASFVVQRQTWFDVLSSLVARNFLTQGAPIRICFHLSVNCGLKAKIFLEFFLFKSRLVRF